MGTGKHTINKNINAINHKPTFMTLLNFFGLCYSIPLAQKNTTVGSQQHTNGTQIFTQIFTQEFESNSKTSNKHIVKDK